MVSTEQKSRQDYGRVFLGPILHFFSERLSLATSKKKYFLAREGYWLKQAYEVLSGLNDSEYLYASRAFLSRITISDTNSYQVSLRTSFSGTLKELLVKKFLFTRDEAEAVLHSKKIDQRITLPNDFKLVSRLFEKEREKLESITREAKVSYLSYLKSIGFTGADECILVDIGYSGTIQKLLSILTSQNTDGFYLIASKSGSQPIAGRTVCMEGCLKENVQMGEGYTLLDRSLIIEGLLTSPDGQFIDIREVESSVGGQNFLFFFGRRVRVQNNFSELIDIMNGALDYLESVKHSNISFSRNEIESLMESFLTKPHRIPRCVHSLLDVDDDVTGCGTLNPLKLFGII